MPLLMYLYINKNLIMLYVLNRLKNEAVSAARIYSWPGRKTCWLNLSLCSHHHDVSVPFALATVPFGSAKLPEFPLSLGSGAGEPILFGSNQSFSTETFTSPCTPNIIHCVYKVSARQSQYIPPCLFFCM